MGEVFSTMLPEHEEFIRKQRIFFVGSASLSEEGYVNISPKGYDMLRILSPTEIAYLDLRGGSNKTSEHLKGNRRITLMFIAFEGPPMILRLYGDARVILPESPEWNKLISKFPPPSGARHIIHTTINKVKISPGFNVPFFSYIGERGSLKQWGIKEDN
jgi:hypothetical protein